MKIVKTFALLILVTNLVSCNNQQAGEKSLETEIDSVSYSLGLNMATQLKANFKELKKDLFVQGYSNGMDSLNLLINEKDIKGILNAFFQKREQAVAVKQAEKLEAIKKAGEKSLETEIDSVSYSLGLNMASQLKANFKELKKDLFVQGYRNGMDSLNLLINEKDIKGILNTFFQKQKQAVAVKQAKINEAIKKAGEEFLLKNKSKKGVKTTASGLQYIVLKEGKGDSPVATSQVKVHYHGTLVDGTVFESSVKKKTPHTIYVNQVIKGWVEGLQLMKVGAKYKFYIPQELAYGARPGPEGVVKPFMPLVFELELLEIVKK